MTTTTNLAKFGFRELKLLELLLTAMREQGLPSDFDNEVVRPMMNTNSGYVFLTNYDLQVAMMNGNKLETFYHCSECGFEGFKEEFIEAHNHSASEVCKIEIGHCVINNGEK